MLEGFGQCPERDRGRRVSVSENVRRSNCWPREGCRRSRGVPKGSVRGTDAKMRMLDGDNCRADDGQGQS